MPLGFEPSIAQGMAAMGERYGDRLVNQLTQAGATIENGLKAVTTMKELQSLSQNLSQISPESPDYQQKLMQLGAAHPFAMQDPRGQALISMGNQAHLQWQHQQYAMQAADRVDARATRHDDMAYRRAVAVQGMRMKAGEQELDPLTEVTPQPGFSGNAAMDDAGGQPDGESEPGYEAPPPPAGFSSGAANVRPARDLTEAEILNNKVAAAESVLGARPTAKSRLGLVKQYGGIAAKSDAAEGRNDFHREMFYAGQAAKDEFAAKQNAFKEKMAEKSHQSKLDEIQYRIDNAQERVSDADKLDARTKAKAYTDAQLATVNASDTYKSEAQAHEGRAKAEYYDALKALGASGARKQGGGSTEKGWKISPNNPNWEINDETKQVRPKK